MEERREYLKNNGESNDFHVPLDTILMNEKEFTKKEIHDHVLTLASGYETLGLALAHNLLLLAMNPDKQEILYQEIKNIEDLNNFESINDLTYLDMALKETFRLMPTVPLIMREVLEDLELEPGLILPKGVNLLMNIYYFHRIRKIWGEDVDSFVPERFLPKNIESRQNFSFIPFSNGPR